MHRMGNCPLRSAPSSVAYTQEMGGDSLMGTASHFEERVIHFRLAKVHFNK
jgi:hypothetical protein